MNELIFKGKQIFMGREIPVIYGGFGENQKCISDKTVAELHNMQNRHVREAITNNNKRFKENIDFIDVKKGVDVVDTSELLADIGYTKQMIIQAEHIYILSRRGYAKLIKIFDTDLAWEVYEKLLDEYFYLKEQEEIVYPKLPTTYIEALKQLVSSVEENGRLQEQLEEQEYFTNKFLRNIKLENPRPVVYM